MSLLKDIHNPKDLKMCRRNQLPKLAQELRETIVDVVSKKGGHLASSLGTVELTIALHYVFESPEEKIVWDVGHQAYAHKLLTERQERFATLRQYQGLSGFTKISESVYDAFTTGHSSTSISAGLGITCAKRLKGHKSKVVAVIGDGALTAGMAYEGLNQAGDIHKDLIVILNDNDMSIAPNVGALSSFLSRAFSKKYLRRMRSEIGDFLKSLPKIGDDVFQLAKRSEESFKAFITPGMLFEAFNFDYFGPINGHNLDHLIDILNNIKCLNGPVLLHVTTQKGKGYSFAEKNPVYFHGVGCFEVDSGSCIINKCAIPSYTEVFGQTLTEMAEKDSRIVAITAAMPEGTGLCNFANAYPDRFFDVGIAEQHGVTFAAGMATEGLRPVVAIYSTFLQRAYDQILHDICIESLPVIFAMDRGGIVGEDGPTHHGLFDFSFLRSLPNMVVMAPKDENELRRMVKTAVEYEKGPIAFRYPRGIGEGVQLEKDLDVIPIGEAQKLADGEDVLLLAIGRPVNDALAARSMLAEEGIYATVVNCRYVKPLDMDLIGALAQHIPNIITIEENVLQGGFGSAVLEALTDEGFSNLIVKRIGIPDTFVEHGTQKTLRDKYGITANGIVRVAKEMLTECQHPALALTSSLSKKAL